jgi:hypothetical protein
MHGGAVGAVGGTMQMNAGRLLRRMEQLHLCYVSRDWWTWHPLVGLPPEPVRAVAGEPPADRA